MMNVMNVCFTPDDDSGHTFSFLVECPGGRGLFVILDWKVDKIVGVGMMSM